MAQIQRLPTDAAAQIKASANLSSLNDVVIGLLENAFDAEAQNVNIKVDFARASCWIHDDGTGIYPSNFEETGGLCKPFHTSNISDSTSLQVSKGLFLSSVAAVAVLSVTSRYGGFNDANALILHFSRPATRLIPAPEHMALELGDHGTKVSLYDLFGNMAVRVKQRPATEGDRAAREREWNNLCIAVTGCMLAYGRPLHINMKGGDSNQVFNVSSIQAAQRQIISSAGASLRLHLAKSILQQAFHLFISPTWIPISARTNSIVVQAIMSAKPTPQRHLQFICIDNRYMPPEGSCEILYESINRTFWNSSFGQTDDDLPDQCKTQGQSHASRQNFKRWPMFVMLIQCSDLHNTYNVCRQEFIANLTGIVTALVTRFLTEHHQQPRRSTKTRNEAAIISQGPASNIILPTRTTSMSATTSSGETTQNPFSTSDDVFAALGVKVKLPANRSKDIFPIHKDDALFRSQFISSRNRSVLTEGSNIKLPSVSNETHNDGVVIGEPISMAYSTDNMHQDAVNLSFKQKSEDEGYCSPTTQPRIPEDKYIKWTDPKTRQEFRINVRTGFVVKLRDSQRPLTMNESLTQTALLRVRHNILPRLLRSSDGIAPPKDGSWAKEFFQNWHNPVFETTQPRIPTAVPDTQYSDIPSLCENGCMPSTDLPGDVITQAKLRLSKIALRDAAVISQVDSKFILIKVPDLEAKPSNDMVVLVDQHAADERVGVEKLLEDLCSMPSQSVSAYLSPSNQKSAIDTIILEQPLFLQVQSQEYNLLKRSAPFFSQWGILYDLMSSADSQQSHQLTVLSLPACIAQRCKLEPMLLLNLLLSEAWKREERSSDTDQTPSANTNWVTKMRGCPSGILELVNSRACRSAIMFNDVLTIDQCRKLISDLAKCQFPFQCAHGRPSMVPLLNLSEDSDTLTTSRTEDDFTDAWKLWTGEQ